MPETRAELLAWALAEAPTEGLQRQISALSEADLRELVAEMRDDLATIERDGRLAWLWAADDAGSEPVIRLDLSPQIPPTAG